MGTNEELRDATDALALEVHDLSGRLSAKELLHQRTQRLTRLSLGLGIVAIAAALVAVLAMIRVNSVNAYWSGCFSAWGAASSERQKVLSDAAEEVAEKEGKRDVAMGVLVDYRGAPSNAATDQAKADYREADKAKIAAELHLQFLRDQYPAPQIENYCTRMKKDGKDPKARGE